MAVFDLVAVFNVVAVFAPVDFLCSNAVLVLFVQLPWVHVPLRYGQLFASLTFDAVVFELEHEVLLQFCAVLLFPHADANEIAPMSKQAIIAVSKENFCLMATPYGFDWMQYIVKYTI